MSSENPGDGNDNNNADASVAKTAGFVVFSGIAMSILKAINPWNKPKPLDQDEAKPIAQPTHLIHTQESIFKESLQKPVADVEKNIPITSSSSRMVEIVRGDTLWGFSKKYGVSIEAIKEANGLEGDTIYAGKKLVIP